MKKLVILTGAGISAESGLQTFRDADGLWEGHAIEDVATPGGFARNPQLVLEFYNYRRRQVAEAIPNLAHKILAELEQWFEVNIITQNVDDLHERAGSTKVLHLHGEIFKMRSSADEHLVYDIREDIALGDSAEDGAQLRPNIVWFGEEVPMMDVAIQITRHADLFAVIGTSLLVYPAASLLHYKPEEVKCFIVDKKIPSISPLQEMVYIEKNATLGVMEMKEHLLRLL